MLNTVYSAWPSFTDEEIEAASSVLRSNKVNYWTGDHGKAFEKEFAEWTGTSYAVAVANGTLALDAAWIALGVGPGDEVICTPRTFLASASSIVLAGAKPVFADVDRDSQNISPKTVESLITKKTKAVLCVHLAGWPCDMPGFLELSKKSGFSLVEDCAQAHGAKINGRSVGSFGDVNAWSFCQDKIMTTAGEGGMVTLNDEALWKKVWAYKDHGKSWDAVYNRQHPEGFRWLHESWGTNWRMTEIQSAIGRIQIRNMPEWQAARRRNAERLIEAFSAIPALRIPVPSSEIDHAWYKFYAFVELDALKDGWSRDRILQEFVDIGVPCYAGSCPEVYREKAFEDTGFAPPQRLPIAAELGQTSLMFLVHPTLKDNEIEKTIDTVKTMMAKASR